MKFPHVIKLRAIIPTASMADIAFLLVIFFILTTTFSVDKTNLFLPQALERDEIMDKRAAYIIVDKYGILKFSAGTEQSRDINIEDLQAHIDGALKENPAKEFVIKADRNVKYVIVEQIIDDLRQSKVRRIYLLSEPKAPS